MKKILSILIIALFTAGCDNNILSHNDFVGEYEMKSEITAVYGETEYSEQSSASSVVTIYKEKNKLFVQTDHFGMPFLHGDNPISLEEEKEEQTSENQGTNIENVTVKTCTTYIENGLIHRVFQGELVKSLPIQVQYANSSKLVMKNSEAFDLTFVNITGDVLASMPIHFEYGPIIKQNDVLTWEIALTPIHPNSDRDIYIAIRYKNVLKKIK